MQNRFLEDDAYIEYSSKTEFMAQIESVNANTSWVHRLVSDLIIDEQNISHSQAQIHTNGPHGTKLFLLPKGLNLFDEEPIPIRSCALSSMFQRLGIGGDILRHLTPKGIHEITRLGREYMPDKVVQIPIVDNKANAFLSSNYVKIPSSLVFAEFEKCLLDSLEASVQDFKGYFSYDTSGAIFTLDIQKEVDDKPYNVVCAISTSDNGTSGINIHAYLKSKANEIPLISTISMVHKGCSDIEVLRENIKLLNGAIDGGVKRLEELIHIEIKNPESCTKRIAEKCKLPKKAILKVLYENKNEIKSAFDIFLLASSILKDETNQKARIRLQGDFLKIMNLDFSQYDLQGGYKW